MVKKLILICTLALLASVSVSARSLVLVLSDSTKIYFLLDDKPAPITASPSLSRTVPETRTWANAVSDARAIAARVRTKCFFILVSIVSV